MKHLKTPEKHKGKSIKFIMEKNKMTLEENITVIINKLKSMSGKMLSFEKRLKKLEVDIAEGKLLPETTITVGDFQPNEKFVKWYGEVFNDPIVEAVEDPYKGADEEAERQAIEEAIEEHPEDEVSPEVLEKLDEVVNDG